MDILTRARIISFPLIHRSYKRALLVSPDRRLLFVIRWEKSRRILTWCRLSLLLIFESRFIAFSNLDLWIRSSLVKLIYGTVNHWEKAASFHTEVYRISNRESSVCEGNKFSKSHVFLHKVLTKWGLLMNISAFCGSLATYAPMIYMTLCVMFLMRTDKLRGQTGGG